MICVFVMYFWISLIYTYITLTVETLNNHLGICLNILKWNSYYENDTYFKCLDYTIYIYVYIYISRNQLKEKLFNSSVDFFEKIKYLKNGQWTMRDEIKHE